MPYDSVFKPDLFANQTIIVTGGGSGIGRCTAHELAHLGAHTVLIGRKLEKLQAVAAELEEDGFKCDYFSCDIRDEDSVKDVIKTIVERRGAIHGLVNNAGGQFPSPLNSINKKGWDAVVATNLTGGFLFAREAFNQSMSKTGGSIVNIVADMWGGMPGMGGFPGMGAMGAKPKKEREQISAEERRARKARRKAASKSRKKGR